MVKRLGNLTEQKQGVSALLYPDPATGKRDARPSRTTEKTLRIAETFTSRQGEGLLTGVPSFFIRTSGCNLRCWFCDTPYASWTPEGSRQSVGELVDRARRASLPSSDRVPLPGNEVAGGDDAIGHVVLTGGEPLVASGIVELATRLRDAGLHITIETAGTVDVEIPCDLLSLSPKLSASTPDAVEHPQWAKTHADRRLPMETMRRLIARAPAAQVKFVVDSPEEFDEILGVVEQLAVAADDVWIMPQGITVDQLDAAAQWLVPWTSDRGFRYCDRMQIRWYGNRRGT